MQGSRVSESKKRQSRLVRKIGERMREARELCNMTQSEAARRLGYRNSAKLSKIEHASDTNSVPLYIIVDAAKLYDVSVGFLMGVSDDWEEDVRGSVEREASRWIGEAWEAMRRRDIEVMAMLKKRVDFVAETIPDLASCALRTQAALERFIELNPQFEEMMGSNTLSISLEKMQESVRVADSNLKRFKVESQALTGSARQLGLFEQE